MVGSLGAKLLTLLILQILCDGLDGQQTLPARSQRSLLDLPHVESLPPLGWNSVGGGFGVSGGLGVSGVGGWAYNPVGLGHMSKDELLTLLEAWKEVEQESATKPAIPPPETTSQRPPPPPPPPALSPPPRPIPIPVSLPGPDLPSTPPLPSGSPITVRLPAFVPVRLAAVFTPPAETGAGAAEAGNSPGDTEDNMTTDGVTDEQIAPRLFRFMSMPVVRQRPQSNPLSQYVVRNTLDSVDADTSPVRHLVKPEVKPKAEEAAAPPAISRASGHRAPFFRPRFGVPPHLANARFELVPSSQVIGDWQE
ncbi:LOW QUALITY PROTEIN: histone-lysine N-methyltransferase 2B [Drosophila ficusphila]|uniref:LOW QUALITY PROTEIN: histone-lysine N-methyltransferase 2B n=1 Tax=Drosophila ficusphila TaxID=30025 RepID=UPI001C893D99|nr:LOW QUALITY PROTEIN: histone-lysine N-methyltransferase 2B [Drosophila ficusphila]